MRERGSMTIDSHSEKPSDDAVSLSHDELAQRLAGGNVPLVNNSAVLGRLLSDHGGGVETSCGLHPAALLTNGQYMNGDIAGKLVENLKDSCAPLASPTNDFGKAAGYNAPGMDVQKVAFVFDQMKPP